MRQNPFTGSPKLVLTTFSNNRTRRRRKEGGGRARALAADRNNSVDKAVLQIERKQQQPRSIDTLRNEALGQLSSTTISTKGTELTGKKFAGFIAVPSQAQANSRSFIAEYCRNINHGSQAAFSFRRNPPRRQFSKD